MAGRTVGSIEVTVTADTGQLKAKLIKDGKVAGGAFKQAIESQTKDIRAKIDEIETSEAAKRAEAIVKLLKTRIEAQLKGIDLGIDTREAMADLRTFEAFAEAREIALNVKLSERDIAEINARIRAMSADSEAADIQFKADLTQANIGLQRFLAERHETDVQFDADLDQINRNLARFSAEQHEAKIRLVIEDQRARAALKAFEYAAERNELAIPILADLDSFNRSILETRAKMKADRVDLAVAAETKAAAAQIEILRERVENNQLQLFTKADITQARATIAAFHELQENNDIDIPVNADLDQLDAALDRAAIAMASKMDSAGEKAGSSFGGGTGRGLSLRMKAIIGGIVALMEPAGVALQGLLSVGTSVLSSGFSAMGGAAGAAAPALAAVGASLATLKVGFTGMGDALGSVSEEFSASLAEGRAFNSNSKEIRAAMANLAPAAREVVEAFSGLQPQFAGIRQVVQQNLFSGLGASLSSLGKDVIPQIGTGLAGLARSFNTFFKGLAADARGINFGELFADLKPIVDSLLDAFRSLFRSIEPFLHAAAPAAQMLADSFKAGARSVEDMVKSASGAEKITDFLVEGVVSLREWGKLLKATGDALFTLFNTGKKEGDGFVTRLTGIITKWDDWMESVEGQKALEKFFATGRAFAEDLKPVLTGLKGFFENLISPGAEKRFEAFGESIGRVLPTLGSLFEIIGRAQILNTMAAALAEIAKAIDPIVPQLQRMADSVGTALNSALVAAVPLLKLAATALGVIADIIGTVADGFSDLPGPIQTVVVALGTLFLLRDKIGSFGQSFLKIRDNIILLRPAFNDVGQSFTNMFNGMKAMDFSKVMDGVKTLGPALMQAGKSAGAAAGVAIAGALGIAFGAQMVSQSHDMSGKVMGVMSIIGSAMGAFAAGGPVVGTVTVGLGLIGAAFMASAQKAKDAAADVTGYADALEEVAASGDATAIVTRVMDRLADQAGVVADTFDDVGFSVGEWARGMADHTQDASDGMETFVSKFGSSGKALAKMLNDGVMSTEDLSDAFKRAASAGALPEGPIRDVGFALEAMGVDGREAGKIFDFLHDTGARLGQGQEELDQKVRLTGDGLKGLEDGGVAAAAGLAAGSPEAIALEEALAKLDQQQIDAAASAANFGDEAGTAATDTEDFKKATEDLEDALGKIDITKVFSDAGAAAARFEGLKRKMEETADAAGEMKSAFDLLVGTQLSAQEAASDYEQTIDDMNKMMEDGEGISGQFAATFDLTEEGGRNVAEALRGGIEQIGAWGEAQIATGHGAEEVTAGMLSMREGLIDAASQFFASREEAAAFVDQLNLTPDTIATTVSVAGMQKALDDLTEFDRDLDGIPDSKDMQFNAPTIETIRAKAAELGVDISKIPDDVVVEFFANKLRESLEDVEILGGNIDDLDGMHPEATVTVRNEASKVIDPVAVALGNFVGGYDATITVDNQATPEIDEALIAAGNFDGFAGEATLAVDNAEAKKRLTNAITAGKTWNESVYKAKLATEDEEAKASMEAAFIGGTAWDTADYSATIGIYNEATQVLKDTSAAGEAFGLLSPSATIGVVDEFTTPMTTAMDQAGAFGLLSPTATLGVVDNATPTVDGAIGKAAEFGGVFANATIGVNDNATGAIDGITGKLDTLFGFGGTGTGTVHINAEGATEAKDQVQDVKDAVQDLDGESASPKITLPTQPTVKSQLDGLKTQLTNLNAQTAAPKINLPTWFTAISQVGALAQAIRNIPDGSANITVTGVQAGINSVNNLQQEIRELRDKTVTITTRRVTEIVGGGMTGGFVKGAMAGQMVTGPGLMQVGERGLDEAIIPLQLPLNRVDPSVRDLAALLRGEGLKGLKPGPTKIINQYMTVNTVVQDPVAVATQVVNRSAMLAHN